MSHFEEEQYVAPWVGWLTIGILMGVAGAIYVDYRSAGLDASTLFWVSLVLVFVGWLLTAIKMTTSVDDEGIRIKTMHFIDRKILFSDIETAAARTYKPLIEYGGWGYRIGPNGKAYNMRGNRGVQLHLKNGGRVMIGSQRADEFSAAIQAHLQ